MTILKYFELALNKEKLQYELLNFAQTFQQKHKSAFPPQQKTRALDGVSVSEYIFFLS